MPTPSSPRRDGLVLSLRVTACDLDGLDEIRTAMRQLGVVLSRHAAARAALRRGLAAMQQDAINPSGTPA